MFDFIKNLFSGIISFVTGLVGRKKSQENQPTIKAATPKSRKSKGYFMELDEADEQKAAEVIGQVKAVASKTLEQAKDVVSKTSEQVAQSVKEAEPTKTLAKVVGTQPDKAPAKTPAKVAAAEPAKAEPAKTPAKVAAPGPAKAEPAKTPVKVELVQTAQGVKAEPAKPSKALAASANGQNQTETTFAPKYLAPSVSSNGRRRPGPNMNPFLDMARQVKTQG
jgi:type IV secretory pathway VirJ component